MMKNVPLRGSVGMAVALACLTYGSFAQADVIVDRETDDGRYYHFEDDLMDATATAPNGWVIRGVHKPKRALLLRVRASFVPQMLHSVEQI